MKPIVSIIMPVYNAEAYLANAIDSVLAQTFTQFELILINDGSTDKSPQICDDYSRNDGRIRVLHKENGGICSARNAGIRMAIGEYIGFMDNDDYFDPNLIKENYGLLEKHQADWIKFGKIEVLIQDDKELVQKRTEFNPSIFEKNEILDNLINLRAEDVMTFVWDSLFSKKIIEENNLSFDEKFKMGNEDIDFCERYAGFSNKIIVNPKHYYTHYTRLGISTSSKYSKDKITSYLYLLNKSNDRYQEYGINLNKNKEEYAYVITKQMVVSICQKLNDAGQLITRKEKAEILKAIKNSPEFEKFNQISENKIIKKSIKLFIYNRLFLLNRFRTLLFVDMYSRKAIYFIRALKSTGGNK
ncbi:glycosyltransferase family 2 protein [Jeotgalibaca porci]|uniref:glycosyltransferase family 2 protein n=1 Tax=Jeotgalibaca porci TaxID=1868793 RepID=UPI003F902080